MGKLAKKEVKLYLNVKYFDSERGDNSKYKALAVKGVIIV